MLALLLTSFGCGAVAESAPADSVPKISLVIMTPRAAHVFTNERYHFLADVMRSDGSPASVQVIWSALGASVTPQGDFIAPEEPGDYRVVAKAYDSDASDSGVVTVTVDRGDDPPPPPAGPLPPPPPPPNQCSNEPSGLTWSNERAFDAKVENGWADRGDRSFSIVVDSSAPHSPPNVGQAKYYVGLPSGSGPIATWINPPPGLRTLYACYWIKMSPNWTATSQATKSIFFHIGTPGSTGRVYSAIRGTPTMAAEIDFQAMGTRINAPGPTQQQISWNGYPNQNPGSATVTRGQWVKWEILLTANTPGQYDGTAEWWLNGVKVGSYSKIGYSGPAETGSSNTWREVNWNPTWGGGGSTPPQEQYMWFDHIYLSGKP
ncbi:MAG TPA: hypothetical protein VGP87_12630 [Gemmatimonadales bacterium]|nr:hypothetical protein [Gemmatimonadales bacterium]